MPNKTFYINKDNYDRLKSVENQSGLINRLLEEFYTPVELQPNFNNRTQDRVNPMVLKKQERHYNSDDFKDSGELTIEPLDE